MKNPACLDPFKFFIFYFLWNPFEFLLNEQNKADPWNLREREHLLQEFMNKHKT